MNNSIEPKQFAFFQGCMIPVKLPYLEQVARAVIPLLNTELVDIEGFTCCPDPVGMGSVDQLTWVTIGARNISLAEKQGLDMLTLCNGCAYTLRHTLHDLHTSPELHQRVNNILAETGHTYQGISDVKHFLTWLAKDVGPEAIRKLVKRPLTGLKVATHTGCHLLSPYELHNFDDSENPVIFDQLVEALDATAVDYESKTTCCGIGFAVSGQPDPSNNVLAKKLTDIHDAGADCIAVGCPFCYQQFDMGQLLAGRAMGLEFKIPVLNYLQLLGFALGFSEEEMQLKAHKIKIDNTSMGAWMEEFAK